MSVKSKGINAERELVHMFWSNGWSAIRVAGSGSSKYPSPDIIASNSARKIALESKITKEQYKHFSNAEISDLNEFCRGFGAEPWIAIKFKGEGWFFIKTSDLHLTSGNYSVSLELIKSKGIGFDKLIEINKGK